MKITIKEASEFIDVSERTIFYWIDEGKIKKYEEDGRTLLDKEDVLKQKPTVITLFNQKGGVAKTSLTYLLADYFDYRNDLKILICDFDQQANLTQCFIKYEELYNDEGNIRLYSLYDYFVNRTPLNKIVFEYNKNIDILPADIKMATIENIDSKILEMKEANEFNSLFKKYNIIIIDCPPALNTFSRFGLILSNYVFCPVQLEPSAYRGLSAALDSILMYKSASRFIDFKIIINEHTRRAVIKEIYREKYQTELKEKLLDFTLPEFVGIVERAEIFDNLFHKNEGTKSLNRIKDMMDSIYNFIYLERTTGGK